MKTAISVGPILILKTMDPIGVMHTLLQSEENIQLTAQLMMALIQVKKVMTKRIFMKLIQLNEQTREQLKLVKKSHVVLLRLDLMPLICQNI